VFWGDNFVELCCRVLGEQILCNWNVQLWGQIVCNWTVYVWGAKCVELDFICLEGKLCGIVLNTFGGEEILWNWNV
jgi:hypothetical protein